MRGNIEAGAAEERYFMSKSYLNRDEKKTVLVVAAFTDYLKKLADATPNMVRRKNLRMSRTWALKAMDTFFTNVDQVQVQAVLKNADQMEVVARYKDQAIREYKAMLELDSTTPVETEDLMEICGQAVEICKVCEPVPGCPLRVLLLKYDVPVANENPGQGCPYKA